MKAVNWDDTKKVMDTRAVTLSLYLMMSYKILCRLKNNNVHSPNKPECLNFQKFQPFIPKYLLEHQYVLETSYIKMILTICSIH